MATDVEAQTLGRFSERRFAIVSAAGTCALAAVIFAPILYYMVLQWRMQADYSHGFLIAPLALYFAWERRGKLRRAPLEPSWWGLVPLALGAAVRLPSESAASLMRRADRALVVAEEAGGKSPVLI